MTHSPRTITTIKVALRIAGEGDIGLTHHHLAWLHDEETDVYHTVGEHGRYIAYRTKDDATSPDEGLYTLRHRPAPEAAWTTLGSFPTLEAVKLAADTHENAVSGP